MGVISSTLVSMCVMLCVSVWKHRIIEQKKMEWKWGKKKSRQCCLATKYSIRQTVNSHPHTNETLLYRVHSTAHTPHIQVIIMGHQHPPAYLLKKYYSQRNFQLRGEMVGRSLDRWCACALVCVFCCQSISIVEDTQQGKSEKIEMRGWWNIEKKATRSLYCFWKDAVGIQHTQIYERPLLLVSCWMNSPAGPSSPTMRRSVCSKNELDDCWLWHVPQYIPKGFLHSISPSTCLSSISLTLL